MDTAVVVINPKDNVGVAIAEVKKGETVAVGAGNTLQAEDDIPRNHKIALVDIPANAPVIKYGEKIGTAGRAVAAGSWVHTHNLKVEET